MLPVVALSDAFVLSERVGIEQAAYRDNLTVYWNGPADIDPIKQKRLLSSAIENRSFGIAINPSSRYLLNETLLDAVHHGVPVVVMLNPLPVGPAQGLSYVLQDYDSSATLVTDYVLSLEKSAGDLILVGPDTSLPGGQERLSALEDMLRKRAPHLHIADRIAGPEGVGLYESALEQSLSEHPQVHTVLALTRKAGLAAVAAARVLRHRSQIHIVDYDQSLELFMLLRRRELDAIVVPDLRMVGRIAVENILAERSKSAVRPVTLVPSHLITPKNIDDESTQQLLLMKWERP